MGSWWLVWRECVGISVGSSMKRASGDIYVYGQDG